MSAWLLNMRRWHKHIILEPKAILNHLQNFIRLKSEALYYFKNSMVDPPCIKTEYWYEKIKDTQLNKNRPLFVDRLFEIKDFFNISNFEVLKYFLKFGFPNTERFKHHLNVFFKDRTDKGTLKKAYEHSSFHYTLRLMLAYERYSMITDYLDYIVDNLGKNINDWSVLDYGCGVSDIGLLLSSLGAKTAICDLSDNKFEFTQYRFKRRNLKAEIIAIANTEEYPTLRKLEYDLIIAVEVFDHVRDPLKLLRNLTSAIKLGGYLFDTMGTNFKRQFRGDHLEEANKIGNSKEYRDFHHAHHVQLFPETNLQYLYKRIR